MRSAFTRLPHPVQGKGEPHYDEAGQGQNVHAEENVFGQHWHCPGCLRDLTRHTLSKNYDIAASTMTGVVGARDTQRCYG